MSAVARGQFDSIAGTWKSSDGSRLVFNNTSLVGDITAQGQATVHNYVHPKDNYQEGSGKYDATLSRDRGDTSGIVGDISFVSKKAAISGPSYEQDTIQVTSTGGTKVYFKESDIVTLPKDVTVTDNQLPIDGGIAESGSYTLTKRTAVKNTPSDTAPVEFYLEAGDKINFDMRLLKTVIVGFLTSAIVVFVVMFKWINETSRKVRFSSDLSIICGKSLVYSLINRYNRKVGFTENF